MKKIFLFFLLSLILIVSSCGSQTGQVVKDINEEVTVYKSPTCSCCEGYISELKRKGFEIKTINLNNMDSVKSKYNIPWDMQSCHTSIIGNYFVEGHVPIEAVNKLLSEKPEIDGIALAGMPSGSPGMPSGSPGMPGRKKDVFEIYALKDGEYSLFMEI